MRVISQDGSIDVPYESFCFAITGDNFIIASRNIVVRVGEIVNCVMAKYSTDIKAKKSMDMLHDAYMLYVSYQTMSESQRVLFPGGLMEVTQENIFGIFRFLDDCDV